MTSLAQFIVENPVGAVVDGVSFEHQTRGQAGYAAVRSALLPIEQSRVTNPDLIPAKFVFADDAPGVVYDLIASKQIDYAIPYDMARLPAPRAWIEWRLKHDDGRHAGNVGIMLQPTADLKKGNVIVAHGLGYETVMLCVVKASDREAAPHLAFSAVIPPLPVRDERGIQAGVIYASECENVHQLSERDAGLITEITRDIMYALFLINTPRVCEVHDVAHCAKLQRARTKNGKLPLIEYKQMVLKVGVGHTRTIRRGATVGQDHPDTRRLHEVVGHFRTYKEGRDTPHVAYVPHHWRGDPEKGIVIHERIVKREASK